LSPESSDTSPSLDFDSASPDSGFGSGPRPTPSDINYTIIETNFGPILIAFKEEKICAIEMGETEHELQVELMKQYPSPHFICTRLESRTEAEGDAREKARREQIDAILEALERPCGRMINLDLSLD